MVLIGVTGIAVNLWIVMTGWVAVWAHVRHLVYYCLVFSYVQPDVSFPMVVRMLRGKLRLRPVVTQKVEHAVNEFHMRNILRLTA